MSHKNARVDFTDQLSATGERLETVASRIELDANVTEAMKIKQDEHAELVNVTANNAAISKPLVLAINRRNKFYVSAFHKATLKAGLSAEDKVHELVAETFTLKFEKRKASVEWWHGQSGHESAGCTHRVGGPLVSVGCESGPSLGARTRTWAEGNVRPRPLVKQQAVRERERDRETDRQRQTETDRDRQRQTETDRDRQRQTETDRDRL